MGTLRQKTARISLSRKETWSDLDCNFGWHNGIGWSVRNESWETFSWLGDRCDNLDNGWWWMMVRVLAMQMDRSKNTQRDAGGSVNRTCWWIENVNVKWVSWNIFQLFFLCNWMIIVVTDWDRKSWVLRGRFWGKRSRNWIQKKKTSKSIPHIYNLGVICIDTDTHTHIEMGRVCWKNMLTSF